MGVYLTENAPFVKLPKVTSVNRPSQRSGIDPLHFLPFRGGIVP